MPNQPISTDLGVTGGSDGLLTRTGNGAPLTPAQGDNNLALTASAVNGIKTALRVSLNDDGSFKDNTVSATAVNLRAPRTYLTDTSVTANAINVTLTTVTKAQLTGLPLYILLATSNNGATNLSVVCSDGTLTLPVRFGVTPLRSGDLLSGKIITVIGDATQFQLQTVLSPSTDAEVAQTGFKGLVIKNNSGTPASQIDITADEIILTRATGGFLRATAFSVTIDYLTSGVVLGLDTSGAAAVGWWYIWAVAKTDGTGISAVLSASATIPAFANLAGYSATTSFYCLLGQIYATDATNLTRMYASDRKVSIPPKSLFNLFTRSATTNTTGLTTVATGQFVSIASNPNPNAGSALANLAIAVPPNARSISGFMGSPNGIGTVCAMSVAGSLGATNDVGIGECRAAMYDQGGIAWLYTVAQRFDIPLVDRAGAGFYWRGYSDSNSTTFCVDVSGYTW